MKKLSKDKVIIYLFPAVAVLLILFNVFIIRDKLSADISLTRSSTQTMYADSYFDTHEYPDLLLRNVVKGKTVKVARRIKTYDEYGTYGRDDEDGNPFDKHYLIDNDYTRWFELYAGEVVIDESLPSGKEVKAAFEERMDDFSDIGEANDMLRYSFPLNREKVQQASAFWYSWYYHSFSEKKGKEDNKDMLPNIYVNLNGAENDDTFVAVWTNKQDLYFMTEEYYLSVLSKSS